MALLTLLPGSWELAAPSVPKRSPEATSSMPRIGKHKLGRKSSHLVFSNPKRGRGKFSLVERGMGRVTTGPQ